MILDNEFNWDTHINELNKPLTKTVNGFKIITYHVPGDKKSVLYYVYKYAKTEYDIEVYICA